MVDRHFVLGALCIAALAANGIEAAPRQTEKRFDALHQTSSASGEAEITAQRIQAHVSWLASDENRGRATGKGQLENRVGPYIEAELSALGFAPKGDAAGTTYRQPFYARSWGDPGTHNHGGDKLDPKNWGVQPNEHGVALDRAGKPVTMAPLPASRIALLSKAAAAPAPNTYNLVAFLEGKDPAKRNEIVVMGAHMDHIGERSFGGGDRVYNGADDNGSGTTALLTICRALARDRELGNGPARSVLICFFSGEELGLLGSQYFAGKPTVDFARIKSMLNIDMIGRAQNGKVSVCDDLERGGPNAFHALHDTAGTQLSAVDHNIAAYMRRSDQYPFFARGVPVIFFFEGFEANGRMNSDYHGLGDHVEKLNIPKMQDITRFAYRHLLGAANL